MTIAVRLAGMKADSAAHRRHWICFNEKIEGVTDLVPFNQVYITTYIFTGGTVEITGGHLILM